MQRKKRRHFSAGPVQPKETEGGGAEGTVVPLASCCLRCRNLMPSLWEQIPLPDLHEPETMSILYQGKKSLSSFREGNKKAALSDGRMNMEADLGRNDTERGKQATKKKVPSTHWLSAHADKKAPLISAGTNREEICDNRQCTSHELPLVHTSEMTLDYCFFCHDKKHFL
jgi:hypothetical protein